MQRPVYCFIDDSPFELKLFKDVIEPRFQGVQFVYASTYDECHRLLDEQGLYPSLFVLDLYGREGVQENVSVPQKELLEVRIDKIPNLNVAYDSLEKYNYDKNLQANEFLKRLFSILNEWRNLFSDQCATLDQGSRYGINNFLSVRQNYPSVTAVMYTRKGLFTDAVILSRHNCDGIFIKPPGATDEDIYTETQNQADNLINGWNECIKNRYCLLLQKLTSPEQCVREVAEVLSPSKHHAPTDDDTKQSLMALLRSLQATQSSAEDISSQEISALTQWMWYYYELQ